MNNKTLKYIILLVITVFFVVLVYFAFKQKTLKRIQEDNLVGGGVNITETRTIEPLNIDLGLKSEKSKNDKAIKKEDALVGTGTNLELTDEQKKIIIDDINSGKERKDMLNIELTDEQSKNLQK